jgi:murein DD-endopeptidase MepM/ murein hydrolase activator NlpD
MRKVPGVFCLIAVLYLFFFSIPVHAFRAEVLPRKINPGDVFLIKVSGIRTSAVLHASVSGKEFSFVRCGKGSFVAIGAADIATKPGVHTVRLKVGKKKMKLKLSVRKMSFPEQELTLPEDKVFLKPEDLDRVKKEDERLDDIFEIISRKRWEGDFAPPLNNAVTTVFGTKRIMNGKWISVHRGIDMKADAGEEIRASNDGRVVLEDDLFFGGNTIILDHGQGIYTIYMHLSKFNVSSGDVVSKGDVIGLVGSSGRATGPHLHFGVKVQEMSVNPVSLFDLRL